MNVKTMSTDSVVGTTATLGQEFSFQLTDEQQGMMSVNFVLFLSTAVTILCINYFDARIIFAISNLVNGRVA